jgi:hypothetical protein
MRSKAYILQNICIVDSMKLYNIQYALSRGGGGGIFAIGGQATSPGYASDYVLRFCYTRKNSTRCVHTVCEKSGTKLLSSCNKVDEARSDLLQKACISPCWNNL